MWTWSVSRLKVLVPKILTNLKTKTPVTKKPLTKEYFCNILDLPGTKINFRCNEDDNRHIATVDCDAQWGIHKGKNPYRYL
jgi:hypothetical protein